MLLNNRIIYKDNATLIDYSAPLNDIHASATTLPWIAAEDALYIGSDLPFNHRYFDVSTANDQASVVSVQLWDGDQWNAAVDVIDQTAVAGKSLAQSGIISWTPDKDESWGWEETTEDISDLSTLKIYGLYWARIKFSANLKLTTGVRLIGHRFSTDSDLLSQYPDLMDTNLIAAWESGKTDWKKQTYEAAEYIVTHLREKGVVYSVNQILDWRVFKNASVHKLAEIIYRGLGKDYKDQLSDAMKAFKSAIDVKVYNVDKSGDGRLQPQEKQRIQEFLTR